MEILIYFALKVTPLMYVMTTVVGLYCCIVSIFKLISDEYKTKLFQFFVLMVIVTILLPSQSDLRKVQEYQFKMENSTDGKS